MFLEFQVCAWRVHDMHMTHLHVHGMCIACAWHMRAWHVRRSNSRRATLNSISQKVGSYTERFSVADNFHARHDLSDSYLQLLLLLLALGCGATLVAYMVTHGAGRLGLYRMDVCAAIPSTRMDGWRYAWMCVSVAC